MHLLIDWCKLCFVKLFFLEVVMLVSRLGYKDGIESNFYLKQGNRHGVITGGTGSGKCLGGDVLVRMFDGSVKKAKDIKVGDKLMGMDSTARTVLKTNKGFGDMYKVIPVKGETWVCNDVHILSLQCSYSKGLKYKEGDIVDIPLNEYLETNSKFKHAYKQFRVGVEYNAAKTKLDPYFVGLFLGDGSALHNKLHISPNDVEVVNWLKGYAKDRGWGVTEDLEGNCLGMYFTNAKELTELRELCIKGDREIPKDYLVNCRESRLKLLAGLLDSDGYLSANCFEIITKHNALCEDIKTLARSLGFAAYSRKKEGRIKSTGFCGDYFMVSISGDTNLIPTKLPRKQAKERNQVKDVLRTGFSLEYIGKGDYYGFVIDGDRRFLLWDFTVTHNTVTMQKMIEIFSLHGTAVFVPDVKGDLTGLMKKGILSDGFISTLEKRGITPPKPEGLPVELWAADNVSLGHKIQCPLYSFGVDLLAKVLDLNNNQASVLGALFRIAEEEGYILYSLHDLLEFIADIYENTGDYTARHGSLSKMSLDVIIRKTRGLEDIGADQFFNCSSFTTDLFIRKNDAGYGVVNILQSVDLVKTPKLYGIIVLWLLKTLYDTLPEVGNLPTPKIAFFFDEAHLLFNLKDKNIDSIIENTVRLIRSKGVGVYFVSQTPSDIPDATLEQLGNKIQHVLRASTPRGYRNIRAAAIGLRPNPVLPDFVAEIQQLRVGEALVSLLNNNGQSSITEKVYIMPPCSYIGVAEGEEIIDNIEKSNLNSILYSNNLLDNTEKDQYNDTNDSDYTASLKGFLALILILFFIVLFY